LNFLESTWTVENVNSSLNKSLCPLLANNTAVVAVSAFELRGRSMFSHESMFICEYWRDVHAPTKQKQTIAVA
jgi:hypothetical protein